MQVNLIQTQTSLGIIKSGIPSCNTHKEAKPTETSSNHFLGIKNGINNKFQLLQYQIKAVLRVNGCLQDTMMICWVIIEHACIMLAVCTKPRMKPSRKMHNSHSQLLLTKLTELNTDLSKR
jgi:hypothetical protein